ncbi:MAG: 4-hydroxybenzoyl-CoA reductase [Gemmatimonadales bacterium]|nr:MAG: 4-hydroxybenzoyl-CoA reductase [Gemmatimonadales bacterium]
MLRLPPYTYHRPRTVREAVELLAEHGTEAMPIAGGTDLVPNMKHRLFTPTHLVAVGGIPGLGGIDLRALDDGGWELSIGAAETLASVAESTAVRQHLPALAKAAAHIAGPQHRNRGTIGGNLCLDTRCTYYNQTEFWREALGYCLKKDGSVCHVTRVGAKCVAAHSADTPPVLMTVDARVELEGPEGRRTLPVRELFVADGIWNSQRASDEIINRVLIRIPGPEEALGPIRSGYAKLRQRDSIDFPLLTVAVSARFDPEGRVRQLSGMVTGLGSRPRELTRWEELATGEPLTDEVLEALSERAGRQCTPLENHIVDPEWRKAMVPVITRRALADLTAPAHAS